tara:strand:+ start:5140 stop:5829 length:690 start_codon:yes stop_codon:yes gene_type:complete
MPKTKDPFILNSRFLQFIADCLFDPEKFIVLSPWGQRIGHSRKNWKFLVLKLLLHVALFAHFFYNEVRSKILTLFPFLSKILPSFFFYPCYGFEKGSWGERRVKGTKYYWDYDLFLSERYKIFLNPKQLTCGLWTCHEEKNGNLGRFMICLHVRELGYVGHRSGDASISNYIPAIRYITQKGGYVIRMGDRTMAPLQPIENVIDYTVSKFRTSLMDLYLISQCRFFYWM